MFQEKAFNKKFNSEDKSISLITIGLKHKSYLIKQGEVSYIPEEVLEICAFNRKSANYLCQVRKALVNGGVITSPTWITRVKDKGKITGCWYTLPIFLPKGLKVYKSKFSKGIFNRYHNR